MRATDDAWATEAAHRDLHARFSAADITYRDVSPQELGVERIGHIDLLRERVCGSLWPELLDWLLAGSGGDGRDPRHRLTQSPAIVR